MAETAVQITLSTTGGDASASEIKKASDALQNVTTSSSNMQAKFQERFQHIGLQLFAAQALGTIGLSGEVRQAVMLMNTAVVGAETAAGIASGGFTLLLTALVAVAAAIFKAVQAHKDLADTLIKVAEADDKLLTTTEDKINAMQKYGAVMGGLTPALQTVLTAEQRLAQDQGGALKSAVNAATKALNEQLQTIKENARNVGPLTGALNLLTESLGLTLVGYHNLSAGVYESQAAFQKTKSAIDQNIATQKELAFEAAHSGLTVQQWAEKNAQVAHEMAEKNLKTLQAELSQEDFMRKDSAELAKKFSVGMSDADIASMKKDEEFRKQSLQKQQQEIRQFSTTVGHDFASMFKGMVLQGESFNKAFQNMMDTMLEQFVTYILDMGVKWATQQAVQLAQAQATNIAVAESTAGAAAANVSIWTSMTTVMVAEWEILKAAIMSNPYTAASEPAAASATYTSDSAVAGGVSSGGRAAVGGSVFADTPTLAMFGESGPEMATFSPMSGSGTSTGGAGPGGGGNQDISITINVNGGMIDQNTLSKIGQYIVKTIRGQGQISFA